MGLCSIELSSVEGGQQQATKPTGTLRLKKHCNSGNYIELIMLHLLLARSFGRVGKCKTCE